jgi:Fe2+ transport system protein FeoA
MIAMTAMIATTTPLAATSARPMSLDVMPAHNDGMIVSIGGGRAVVGRLATLGFVPGARVSMVQNFGRGPLIVCVCQARVALGRSEASHIVVEKEPLE